MKVINLAGAATNKVIYNELDGQFADWIKPEKNETLKNYSERYARYLNGLTDEPIALVGFCFGGLVAMEVSKHLQLHSLVTINTPGDSTDISDNFRKSVKVASKLPLDFMIKRLSNRATEHLKSKEALSRSLAKDVGKMLKDINVKFLKWAAVATAGWDQPTPIQFSCPHLALHSEKGTVVKRPKQMPTETLEDMGHLAPMTHPEDLSYIQKQFWKKIPDT